MRFEISIDGGKALSTHSDEGDALAAFRRLKLKGDQEGYLDGVEDNAEVACWYHKIGKTIYRND